MTPAYVVFSREEWDAIRTALLLRDLHERGTVAEEVAR